MSTRRASPKLEAELREFTAAVAHPDTPEARARLRAALGGGRAPLVERAAQTIAAHALEGFDEDLGAAFDRLVVDPVKTDPGCRGKLAVLAALDQLDVGRDELFARACSYVQMEPAWGGPEDTAGPVRARGIAGLSRGRSEQLALLAAELLVDRDATARRAAVAALVHRGDRAHAALLALKLRAGDAEQDVLLACMTGLLALAPAHAVPRLSAMLADDASPSGSLAAIALGQSGRDDALDALLAAAGGVELAGERAHLWRAVGLHRSDRARDTLLALVAEGDTTDACSAVEALASRVEPDIERKAREAAARNAGVDLRAALHRAFEGR